MFSKSTNEQIQHFHSDLTQLFITSSAKLNSIIHQDVSKIQRQMNEVVRASETMIGLARTLVKHSIGLEHLEKEIQSLVEIYEKSSSSISFPMRFDLLLSKLFLVLKRLPSTSFIHPFLLKSLQVSFHSFLFFWFAPIWYFVFYLFILFILFCFFRLRKDRRNKQQHIPKNISVSFFIFILFLFYLVSFKRFVTFYFVYYLFIYFFPIFKFILFCIFLLLGIKGWNHYGRRRRRKTCKDCWRCTTIGCFLSRMFFHFIESIFGGNFKPINGKGSLWFFD